MKLKIKMGVHDNDLYMYILEQCPSITNQSEDDRPKMYFASNGIIITSHLNPYLCLACRGSINILGCQEYDTNKPIRVSCSSNEEAVKQLNRYIDALKEWSNNGYFEGDNFDIYEF